MDRHDIPCFNGNRHPKMKRAAVFLSALLLACSVVACGKVEQETEASHSIPTEESSLSVQGTNNQETSQVQEPVADAESNKILIVYFSRYGNTEYPDDVDATTSASIVVDEKGRHGTTEYVAELIQQSVGGDMHRIETVMSYTADFDKLREVNHDEMDRDYLPELKESSLDISAYDTVFIGYPVWATSVPQAVLSFLEEYDLSGKTVIPFCTHDGYGAGGSYQVIAEASHAAVSPEGLTIEAKDVPSAEAAVAKWLDSIGISSADTNEGQMQGNETLIQITVGDTVLTGVLYDTALAQEIKGYFPLTVTMSGYAGREYYGSIDFYPAQENLTGGGKTFENGDITYCEAHHNMAVFYAQTDNPNLSVDVIPIGKVTSKLSVFDTFDSRVKVTFELLE